jgi:hypothetical protein
MPSQKTKMAENAEIRRSEDGRFSIHPYKSHLILDFFQIKFNFYIFLVLFSLFVVFQKNCYFYMADFSDIDIDDVHVTG